MMPRRMLAAGISTAASIAALPAAAAAALSMDAYKGASEVEWLTGALVLATLLMGVAIGALFMPVWRAIHPKRPARPKEDLEFVRLLRSMRQSMRATDTSIAELREGMVALNEQVRSLNTHVRTREQPVGRPTEARAESPPIGYFSAEPAEVQPHRLPRPLDSMEEIMEEYRRVMEDEGRVDGFLDRRRAVRAMRTGSATLEVVDTPTADLWVLPLGAGGHAILLPSRRMLTRNFPALAANRGEGVRRELGTIFEIEFANLERPVVAKAASAILDGQRVQVVQTGLLRFPRQ